MTLARRALLLSTLTQVDCSIVPRTPKPPAVVDAGTGATPTSKKSGRPTPRGLKPVEIQASPKNLPVVKLPPSRPQSATAPPATLQDHLVWAFKDADPQQRGLMAKDRMQTLLIQICGSVLGDEECMQLVDGFVKDYGYSASGELSTKDFITWLCPNKA